MIPDTTGRLIAFGDIHGCARNLQLVLEAIQPQAEDVLVFLGDMINRGPDAKGVISQVMDLESKCHLYWILGNHEEMLLAAYQGGKSENDFWKKFGGIETLASYNAQSAREIPYDHLKFIAQSYQYEESEKYIFVHAGCDWNVPLDRNTPDKLRWERIDKAVHPHYSGKTVICGHSVQGKILDLGHMICLDTGCGCSPRGRLTALDLKSRIYWQAGGRNKKATIKNLP